jgi:uncharacterized membrane protein YphA (DoxX/SURF4 family)
MNAARSEKFAAFAPAVVRMGLSLVFLWFGYSQLTDTAVWIFWLPEWTAGLPLAAETLVRLNGGAEILLGALLLLGFYTRPVALLLALHMVSIVVSVGYNAIGVRDFGLMLATVSVFLHGHDRFTLDGYIARKRLFNSQAVSI